MIKFITNLPALFIPKIKCLVLTDLHIGLEHELFRLGVVIQPQAEKFKEKISELIKLTKAKILVILGDVKHKVPGISYREMKEIPKFFDSIKADIHITLGNHDSYLKKLLEKKVKFYSSRGFKLKKYGFFHGHAWPSEEVIKCDYIFMGHIHPIIELKNKFGFKSLERVWLKGKLKKDVIENKYKCKTGKLNLIVLPAFNKLLGGVIVNKKLEGNISPIFKKKFIDMKKLKVYLIDGTFMGELDNII